MANTKIIIPGNVKPNAGYQSIRKYFPTAEIYSYKTGVSRSAEIAPPAVEVSTEDVVITEFENNIQWFHGGGEFVEKVKLQQPGASRGEALPGELVIPLEWEENNSPSRGIVSSGLKLLGIHFIKNVAGPGIAKKIAEKAEENNQNILYACDEKFNLAKPFNAADAKAGDNKYLLLIHGTASSTKGSFGGLLDKTGVGIYNDLFKLYKGKIIAYEHRTFSQSPVKNIIELLQQFPDDIRLDVLSHSRGGLLGEVLSRISAKEGTGVFTEAEMKLLGQNEEANALVEEINTLNEVVAARQIKVQRFVRVACPAAGTTLVSDRADKLLNVIFNILSNIPGEITSTIIDGITALITAVVNEKNNTAILPGIECMKPDSNFIKVLNYFETKIDSELIVIAGDAVGEGFINKLKMFLVDSFYKEDNDLVVNTISMKKGTGRTNNFVIHDEKAGNVNHFSYFINKSSSDIILNAFTGNADAARGFYSSTILDKVNVPDIKGTVSRSGKAIADQPVLYVLPGIMGSNLYAADEAIWLNYIKIATGGLRNLKLGMNDGVKADGINGKAYKRLVDYFSNDYYVVPFAYDWRRSIFEAADKLNEHIENTLSQTTHTISFIVHSMGGLVFRAFASKYKEQWNKLKERPNCRVLMLGTPNAGSYSVVRVLMGKDRSISALAALDLTNNKKALLNQFSEYPGLLQLLPARGAQDFGDKSIWQAIKNISGFGYAITDALLEGFLALRRDNFQNYKYDADIVKYIAGRDDQTPERIEIDEINNKLNFYATPRGDGSVTWDTIPEELKGTATFYINTEHGNLANHEASFQGFKELLETGKTIRLSAMQPVTRGETKTELMPEVEQVTVPDEATLAENVMGIKMTKENIPNQQVSISITHGDLGHAAYPLIVGHFEGDGIVEAEKVLDRKLNNYLSLRHATNNYPGAINTHEIVLRKPDCAGAIIVGLGDFGTLTENLLSQTLRQALLTYIIENKVNATENDGNSLTGISYLLIGTGFGGLTIYSSIKALLTAVNEANSFFAGNNYTRYNLISKIEIIELYQHKAVQAGRIISNLISYNSVFSTVAFSPDIIKKASGARTEIPDELQTNWWHRLKISLKEEVKYNDTIVSRIITFNSITDKARNEEKDFEINLSTIDKIIKEAASQTNNDSKLCQTLYELLVPADFKGYGSDLRNIVLLLDKETAQYPWEMMMDAYSDNKEPFVAKTGFLRQLATTTYRTNVEMPVMNNALVVGNPTLNGYYPDLVSAGEEAYQVAALLKKFGYKVNDNYINTAAGGVIKELYPQPYKIVHIAAHGVLKDKKTGKTGIVLGEGIVLTPFDFEKIRKVPELVFINCCSLGKIDKEQEELLQRKYEVAAGIGTQLINMGVKAVIVAGWEVNDDAAFNFSYHFYNELLSGKNFGDAVKNARESTYDNYPQFNTWGAYQCYGDPLYTLRSINNGYSTSEFSFCDPVEAINKLQTLISQAEAATSRDDRDYIKNQTKKVVEAIGIHPEWKDDATIIEQLAELYKRVNTAKEAVEQYELLFSIEDANYTVKTVEQYCNVKVKLAAKQCKAIQADIASTEEDKIEAVKKATETITDLVQRLISLNIKPTSERLNLIGSAYRRLAEINIDNRKAVIDNLKESAFYYHEGYGLFLQKNSVPYYYPLYNWLIISVMVNQFPGIAKTKKYKAGLQVPKAEDLDKLISDAKTYADKLDEVKPDFWHKTSASTGYLLKLILAQTPDEIQRYEAAIVEDHLKAWKKEGSEDKKNAINEHADFVISMFEKFNNELRNQVKFIDEKLSSLRELKQTLG